MQHQEDRIKYSSWMTREPGFDLVLLDWMMPGMNGLDSCRKIREFSQIPVIFRWLAIGGLLMRKGGVSHHG